MNSSSSLIDEFFDLSGCEFDTDFKLPVGIVLFGSVVGQIGREVWSRKGM